MSLLNFLEKTIDCYFTYLPRKTPDKETALQANLIAHRGAHDKKQQIIENTHPAFARALALGCWGIELDVRATADGVLVVNHDATLDRVWGKNAAIKELSFKNLQQLIPQLPTLAEVVEHYGKKLHLFIELKEPFHAEIALKEALRPLIPCEDYHLLSLNEPLFAKLSSFPSAAMLLVALHHNFNQFYRQSLQKHYGGVLGHYLLLNDRKINKMILAKQAVGVGFVNSKFGLYRELNRGLHWIFSNNVALLCQCLQELKDSN
jgi:glycerophosphoryl diester phosphodiesterase